MTVTVTTVTTATRVNGPGSHLLQKDLKSVANTEVGYRGDALAPTPSCPYLLGGGGERQGV